MPGMTDAIEVSVEVPLERERAFAAFTAEFGEWWPPEYTWSQAKLERISLGTAPGDLCSEIGPQGFRADWGRVLAWEPPARLVIAWQIAPSRAPEPDPA